MSPAAHSTFVTRAHVCGAGALVAALLLAGCSSVSTETATPGSSTPATSTSSAEAVDDTGPDSPKESQQVLLALLDEIQVQVGGTWENEDSPSPHSCTISGTSEEGVTFTGSRTMKGTAMDDAQIDALLKLWKAKGFDAAKAKMGVFMSVLAVNRDDKTFFSELRIGDGSSMLLGQAACVPGDVWDELQRVKSEVAR